MFMLGGLSLEQLFLEVGWLQLNSLIELLFFNLDFKFVVKKPSDGILAPVAGDGPCHTLTLQISLQQGHQYFMTKIDLRSEAAIPDETKGVKETR